MILQLGFLESWSAEMGDIDVSCENSNCACKALESLNAHAAGSGVSVTRLRSISVKYLGAARANASSCHLILTVRRGGTGGERYVINSLIRSSGLGSGRDLSSRTLFAMEMAVSREDHVA